MTTFDLAEVRGFVADIDAQMARSQDEACRQHAGLCLEFDAMIRRWCREVFTGRVSFDPDVERAWLAEGSRLIDRAREIIAQAPANAETTSSHDGRESLGSALDQLESLIKRWVRPKLAVGPGARRWLIPGQPSVEEVSRILESLPPLPEDWEPDDPQQRATFRSLGKS